MPHGHGGGAWNCASFTAARDSLADTLERNLDRWAGDEFADSYRDVLGHIRRCTESAPGRALSWHLAKHDLSITRS